MATHRFVAAVALFALAGAACTSVAPMPTASPAGPVHWTYEGDEGPAQWGDLSPEYELCASGLEQSPIDVRAPSPADLADVVFDYRQVPLEILNTGHTIQVNYPPGSFIELEGTTYELLQFHLHAPSEHHIAGRAADAELHLVHRSPDGGLAVVGLFLVEGTENPELAPVFENLPADVSAAQSPGTQINAAGVLPAVRTTYRYPGSLTTPPCSEGVQWVLMTEPVDISTAQLAAFTDLIEGNNRPIQPLNDRQVEEDVTP